VQYPFNLLGFHTTWGAFTYPAIFILTDLTVRLSSMQYARKIIFLSMFPGLLISYAVASSIEATHGMNFIDLFIIHPMPLRIAIACFFAYIIGQFTDMFVFQRYRNNTSWWLAPVLSSTIGNLMDTVVFFFIAFYHCSNLFLSQHWIEIASVDLVFKILISLSAFIPIYGVVLSIVSEVFTKPVTA
jgi:uncharacterized integral membrane protein (TIGR00697 family)